MREVLARMLQKYASIVSEKRLKMMELHSSPDVVRVKAQLAKMIDGLKTLGIYDLIKANPRTSDVMINLVQMRFSLEGSNRREDEEHQLSITGC